MPLEPTTNRRTCSSHAAEAVNINGPIGDQGKVDGIEDASHPVDGCGSAVGNLKTQVSDVLAAITGKPSQFVVVPDEGHSGIVFLVLFLQVDERPHAGVEQRLNPLAMICWFWSAWVSPSEQPIIDDPIGAMARCWSVRMQKFCWNGQARTREGSARIPTSRQEGIQGIQSDLV